MNRDCAPNYGLGLEVVVVVVSFFSVVAGGLTTVVSFFSVAGGFTTVVLFSTFFSGAGEDAVVGATTVFSSHPPRSAALAKMQSNFFIGFWIGCPFVDNGDSNRAKFSALPEKDFGRARLSSRPRLHERARLDRVSPYRRNRQRYNGALYFSPCASATASYVTLPSRVLMPPMRAGCFLHAPSSPRSASSSA